MDEKSSPIFFFKPEWRACKTTNKKIKKKKKCFLKLIFFFPKKTHFFFSKKLFWFFLGNEIQGSHMWTGGTRGLGGHTWTGGPKWPQQGPLAEGHRQKSGARSAPDF
jgi:hypothetical protein